MRAPSFFSPAGLAEGLLSRGQEQQKLFARARECRDGVFSGKVEIRSVIEYSNVCRQECRFCGMAQSSGLRRYVMPDEQFLAILDGLYQAGRRVVMVQTGEHDGGRYLDGLIALLARAKEKHPALVLVAALGSLTDARYEALRRAGVERYLLKFETSDPALYARIKPTDDLPSRLARLESLKRLGFKVSSGNITGLPGQSADSLAQDLLLLKSLDIPMVSTSPFIPSDLSRFAGQPLGDLDLTLNFMATLRILCPRALIPATSALELLGRGGQALGLMAGANAITLHDGTPEKDAEDFVIYRRDRNRPAAALVAAAEKAGLACSNRPLL